MRRTTLLSFALVLLPILVSPAAAQQKDARGCEDHPLFTRMPGSWIHGCTEKAFDAHAFDVGEKLPVTVEGRKWIYRYYPQASAKVVPSELQIIRNFQNAFTAIGGTVRGEKKARTTMELEKDGRDIWVEVTADFTGKYFITVVERQAMAQDVVANAALFAKGLEAVGHVALEGIYFDTAKADLRPESDAAIGEVVKLLRAEPALALYVVGHTDSVGERGANVKLSQARADAVVRALVQKGIAAGRLAPHGNGPYAPVASNATEAGRARNRRVELVTQ